MAPVTVERPCRCTPDPDTGASGVVSITYDDDPLGGTDPPVATCDRCSTPSEALLVQTGFQT
jgi:hypothetical protein